MNVSALRPGVPRHGVWKLVAVAMLLMAVWLGVLPWVGRLPRVSDHIEHMKQKRIHPDAMFYTELEGL